MRVSVLPVTVALAAFTLTGCVANAPGKDSGGPQTIAVTSTDDACTVSSNTVAAGTVSFHITNEGSQTTEFYLLSSDGVRIVAEKENIATGAAADLAVALSPVTTEPPASPACAVTVSVKRRSPSPAKPPIPAAPTQPCCRRLSRII